MALHQARGQAENVEYWIQVMIPHRYGDDSYIGERVNLSIFYDVVPHIPNVGEYVYVNSHAIYAAVVRRDFQYDDAYLDEETGEVKAPVVTVNLFVDEVESGD